MHIDLMATGEIESGTGPSTRLRIPLIKEETASWPCHLQRPLYGFPIKPGEWQVNENGEDTVLSGTHVCVPYINVLDRRQASE